MSYLRPVVLQADSLRTLCVDAWMRHLLALIRDNYVISRGKRGAASGGGGKEVKAARMEMMEEVIAEGEERRAWHILQDCLKALGSTSRPSRRPSLSQMPDLSSYLSTMLPVSLQEEAFHRGALLLRKESVYFDDLFPFFFCLLWRREFRTIDLPPISDQEDRVAVLDVLATSYVECDDDDDDDDVDGEYCERVGTRTAKFRLFESADVSIEESYLLKRALRGMRHLRCLTLWWAADDAMLNVVGAVCLQLESADFWRSSAVTDLGVKMLLSCDLGEAARSPLCHTLLRLGLKETSCTHVGCLAAVAVCPNLEVLTFSHTAIVKDFFAGVRILNLRDEDDEAFPLKRNFSLKTLFLPVTNGAHFHEVVSAFPRLEDLRLWTTVGRMDEVSREDLPSLHSLLLGGLHSSRVLRDLVGAVGRQLTTLKLETVLAPVPLKLVGEHCPNLVELQVINGRLVVGDGSHRCHDPELSRRPAGFLSKLKLVYLFLVQYDRGHMEHRDEEEMEEFDLEDDATIGSSSLSPSGSYRPRSALHCLLMHATQLEGVQANGCAGMDDEGLAHVLKVNPLKNLRRFIMTEAALQPNPLSSSSSSSPSSPTVALTSASALTLFSPLARPMLQCVGDLRHWSVSPQERRRIVAEVQRRTGTKWIATTGH